MEGIKERLLKFLEHLRVGQSVFEKNTGLANGLINNITENVSTKSIIKILNKHPELDLVWLLIGKGEMLMKKEGESLNNDSIDTLISSNKKLIDTNADLVNALKSIYSNSGVGKESLLKQGSILTVRKLRKAAKAGVPDLWHTEDEGLAILGKLLDVNPVSKEE